MNAHTPAPWRVDDRGFHKENGEILDRAGHSVCPHCKKQTYPTAVTMQVLAKGWGVCQLGSLNPKEEYEQHLANARLIAAAPNLLAVCKRAIAVLDAEGIVYGNCDDEPLDVLRALRTAVERAEGKP